jgi:2'-5' RNA ligase
MPYRLFVAIELPEAVKDQLTWLRGDVPGASWVKPNGYHLTLRFLGDGIESERLEAIKDALAAVHGQAFTLRLKGLGRFPPQPTRAARVLWVGVSAPPVLAALYEQVESAVTRLGFAPEERAFHPHITLARLKAFKPESQVDRFLQEHLTFQSEAIAVDEFHLFSSVLSPRGSVYTRQASYDLAGS